MPLMDEFKEERAAIKNRSFQDKVKYFWDYYKWHTIITIVVIIFATVTIYDIATQKAPIFYAAMLNSASLNEENTAAFKQNFIEYAEIDSGEYDVSIDDTLTFSSVAVNELTMSSSEKLMVYTTAGELDIIIGGSDIFPSQAIQEMFHDLRDILSEEQIAKYEPYFYYVDQAYLDAYAEAGGDLKNNTLTEIPAPTKPEEMEEPIPIGIFVTDCDRLADAYLFGGDYTALGVMVNAPHVENALKFIEYIFE